MAFPERRGNQPCGSAWSSVSAWSSRPNVRGESRAQRAGTHAVTSAQAAAVQKEAPQCGDKNPQQFASVSANPLFPFTIHYSPFTFSSTPFRASLTILPVSPAGTPVATVVWRGGTGASVMRLTWLRGRGGSVQGFPSGHYGPDALDERIGPGQHRLKMPEPELRRSGTDGIRNRRRGARAAPRIITREARRSRPASRLPSTLILSPELAEGSKDEGWRRVL